MNFFGILFNNSGHSHNNDNKKLNRLHSIIYYLWMIFLVINIITFK